MQEYSVFKNVNDRPANLYLYTKINYREYVLESFIFCTILISFTFLAKYIGHLVEWGKGQPRGLLLYTTASISKRKQKSFQSSIYIIEKKRTSTERFIYYRKYILLITKPFQYRCTQLQYISAVISQAPSNKDTNNPFDPDFGCHTRDHKKQRMFLFNVNQCRILSKNPDPSPYYMSKKSSLKDFLDL